MTEATMSSQEESSTLLIAMGKAANSMTSKEIKDALEKGDTETRVRAMMNIIRLHVNGEPQNHLIVSVIRYITPLESHLIKKLVLYFWEVVDKRDADGNLLPVMILICNFLRSDLLHPNEYVRGLTLRFLCKLNEVEVIEPLVPSVTNNLDHKNAYVRRSAVLAVHFIFVKFPKLLPDAPLLVEKMMEGESDISVIRNAIDFFSIVAPQNAVRYISRLHAALNFHTAEGPLLMSVIEFCHQRIHTNPMEKAYYVPVLSSMLQSKSPAVRYQCATTLLGLSSSPTAIRQATLAYIDLIKTHSDNSVRLIVVEQLNLMRHAYLHVLQDTLRDILSVLRDSFTAIRERIIELAVELITSRNADIFMQAMKTELSRASGVASEASDATETVAYRLLIIKSIKKALQRYPPAAASMLPFLLDYLCDTSSESREVITLIRDVLFSQPELRRDTMQKILDIFPMMTSSPVMRTALWMLSAYATSPDESLRALRKVKELVAPLRFERPRQEIPGAARSPTVASAIAAGGKKSADPASNVRAVTTVREDGTYVMTYTSVDSASANGATENVVGGGEPTNVDSSGLRLALLRGDHFLSAAVASTLAKLVVRLFVEEAQPAIDAAARTAAQLDAQEILREILRYGTEVGAPNPIDTDTHEHLCLCIAILSNPSAAFMNDVLQVSTAALARTEQQTSQQLAGPDGSAVSGATSGAAVQLGSIDEPIVFSQLSEGREAVMGMPTESAVQESSERAAELFLKKLETTMPLSGFDDPVYCEANITVNQFDVLVDWRLANCTSKQLTNLTIELVSLGGVKLCERPQMYTLNPHETLAVHTSLKVSATETGVIFGTVLYDAPNNQRCSFILNEINVDIMNYVHPGACTAAEFREKWGVFDWENKIAVSTTKRDLPGLVRHIVQELNMQLLEPNELLDEEEPDPELDRLPTEGEGGTSAFLSCNLYAQTNFGEDALANVSVESDGKDLVTGVIRIRSNTQTIAYGMGKKLHMLQSTGNL